jgi:high affinity choline transporter 7
MALGLAATQLTGADLGPDGEATLAAMTDQPALVLPYLLRYAVPQWVGVLGLGAVAAAVMSSVDSSMLSAASLLSWNGYRRLLNPAATAEQVARLVRWLIVILGVLATVVALTYSSVSALWYLCGDLVYCILFPQLTAALFDARANRTGAIAGLAVSIALRLAGGEGTLGLPNLLYPAPVDGIEWPFRTVAMLGGLVTLLVVSRLSGSFDPPKPALVSGRDAAAT